MPKNLIRITVKNKSYFKSRVRAALEDSLPEVLTVRAEHSDVNTKKTKDQYSSSTILIKLG